MIFTISNRRLICWAATIVLTALLSCKKDKGQQASVELAKLPPATQTGANTLGYLKDGLAVPVSNVHCSYIETEQTATIAHYFTFKLIAVDSTSASKQTVTIGLSGGVPRINDNSGFSLEYPQPSLIPWYGEYNIVQNGTATDYQTAFPPAYGQIFFTKLDTVNKIASGTFYFNGANSSHPSVNITDGRFDLHYTTK